MQRRTTRSDTTGWLETLRVLGLVGCVGNGWSLSGCGDKADADGPDGEEEEGDGSSSGGDDSSLYWAGEDSVQQWTLDGDWVER